MKLEPKTVLRYAQGPRRSWKPWVLPGAQVSDTGVFPVVPQTVIGRHLAIGERKDIVT